MRPIRVLTWHVHGNYLLYLAQANVEFYLPVRPDGRDGYGGRDSTFPFSERVRDVPAEAVRELEFDCVLYQSRKHFEEDRHTLLSERQQRLPRIYLEHDCPREHPTNTVHWSDDPEGLLVHVTPFNALMWDDGRTPSRLIEHGVFVPEDVRYTGELDRGIVVVNNLRRRGRLLGRDVFERLREEVPLDLVGMDAATLGGLGEVPPMELAAFEARYRFFFNPIRWTSLGLASLEAMMIGLPVVGLATTELSTVIENGVSGYVDTNLDNLAAAMRELVADRDHAAQLGQGARRRALERFSIERFARDWERSFADVTGRAASTRTLVAPAPTLADGGAR